MSEKRGVKRNARKGRRYYAEKWLEHQPRKNPKFHVKGKSRGKKVIEFPDSLTIESEQDVNVVVSLLGSIREAALKGHFKRIVLDHSGVRVMSPEVALMLVAEIQRCEAYCGTRTVITGTHPREHAVTELLSEIGFYEALSIKEPVLPKAYQSRTYVQVERRNKTLPKVVDSLLECFAKVFEFDDADRKRLHVALIECMDNVFEHAYDPKSHLPHLYKEWWLIGYADHQQSAIGFAFYDQGAGIPATIRKKKSERVLQKLVGWSDGQWIDRAVRRPISRHNSKRRGHGLDKLKRFLDSLGVEGSLRVIANKGDVEFSTSGGNAKVDTIEGGLNGSLIVWTLRGIKTEPVSERSSS
ncbi:hypothetical protein H9L17_15430 [Thermomonas brevis]|uniref:STAS domain-containing protein n=1 Tax=Thermomonas brevis TaxID=215691 RepID=A0A7G9QT54_9GAMM|nr:anti-sigma factor antagonist [Thermomonas brevis]QNN46529.1 hypothetical protein H9L17_15430 [Thermomonas brevis]